MGIMFDKNALDYMPVLKARTDLSIIKDKDKEQRKRQQKEKSNPGSNQIRKKDKNTLSKNFNLLDITV